MLFIMLDISFIKLYIFYVQLYETTDDFISLSITEVKLFIHCTIL